MATEKQKLQLIISLFFVFSLFSQKIYAQGDYAPFEQPEKIKKIVGAKKKSNKKTATTQAAKKVPAKRSDPGQDANIKIDGSAIYEAPNFDSPVLDYLDQGKKVKISKRLYPGIGGLGAFYRIRVRPGVIGYITDTDVDIAGKSRSSRTETPRDDNGDTLNDPLEIQQGMVDDGPKEPGNSILLTRYLGLTYNSYEYTEVLRNISETVATPMFGLKMSGPTGVMGGMPLDINAVFTSTAPTFYNKIATSTSGFMILADMLTQLPLYEGRSFLVFYGFGPVVRYSSWKVKLSKADPSLPPVPSEEVGIGLAANLGAALKLGQKLLIRVEGKYIYEQEKYLGFGAALQFKF